MKISVPRRKLSRSATWEIPFRDVNNPDPRRKESRSRSSASRCRVLVVTDSDPRQINSVPRSTNSESYGVVAGPNMARRRRLLSPSWMVWTHGDARIRYPPAPVTSQISSTSRSGTTTKGAGWWHDPIRTTARPIRTTVQIDPNNSPNLDNNESEA